MSDNNAKIPSQIFRWFEKMKNNYEQSVQLVLQRFENYSTAQQVRLDNAHQQHISNMKEQHRQQVVQSEQQIQQLKNDIEYYKQQIAHQQTNIAQLNTRYDAVMGCLLAEKKKDINIKDIFSEEFEKNIDDQLLQKDKGTDADNNVVEIHQNSQELPVNELVNTSEQTNPESLFEKALEHRANQEFDAAFDLFEQAAKEGHLKAMGAMARSYFLAEGCPEDQLQGLAWLIEAADKGLPQAIKRVEYFNDANPELVLQASKLKEELLVNQ